MTRNGEKKRKEVEFFMSINNEKPWILDFSYRIEPIQIDQEEYDNLMGDIKENAEGATLKNGSYISLKYANIVANPHYVSPKTVERGKMQRELYEEYQQLKNDGILETKDEYIEWKTKAILKEREQNGQHK